MPPLNIEQKEIVDDVYNLVNVGRLRNESHDPAIARVRRCFRHLNNIDMAFTSTSNPRLPIDEHIVHITSGRVSVRCLGTHPSRGLTEIDSRRGSRMDLDSMEGNNAISQLSAGYGNGNGGLVRESWRSLWHHNAAHKLIKMNPPHVIENESVYQTTVARVYWLCNFTCALSGSTVYCINSQYPSLTTFFGTYQDERYLKWDDSWSASHNPVQPPERSTQASKKNVTYDIIQMDSFARSRLLTNSTSATVDCAHVLRKTVSLETVSIFFPSNIVIQKAISFLKSPGSSSFLPRSTA